MHSRQSSNRMITSHDRMVAIHQQSSTVSESNARMESNFDSYRYYNTQSQQHVKQQYRFFKKNLDIKKGYTKDKYMGPYKMHGRRDQTFSAVNAYKRLDRSLSETKKDMSKGTALKKSPERSWQQRRLDRSLSKCDHTTGKYCCSFHRSTALKTKPSDGCG